MFVILVAFVFTNENVKLVDQLRLDLKDNTKQKALIIRL